MNERSDKATNKSNEKFKGRKLMSDENTVLKVFEVLLSQWSVLKFIFKV